jgi:serine phosphatase RsbU (regulator of sigma subunit)
MESANTVLGPGDVLLIFTDGVVEAKTAKGKNSGNCAC